MIQQVLPPEIWYHVPTKQNPADLATRPIDSKHVLDMSLWWHSPNWLSSSGPLALPGQPDILDPTLDIKKSSQISVTNQRGTCNDEGEVNMAAILVSTDPQSTTEDDQSLPIIDIERFSSLQKLINTMTWVLKFVMELSRKVYEHNGARKKALNCIVLQVQREAFSNDIQNLKIHNSVPKVRKFYNYIHSSMRMEYLKLEDV